MVKIISCRYSTPRKCLHWGRWSPTTSLHSPKFSDFIPQAKDRTSVYTYPSCKMCFTTKYCSLLFSLFSHFPPCAVSPEAGDPHLTSYILLLLSPLFWSFVVMWSYMKDVDYWNHLNQKATCRNEMFTYPMKKVTSLCQETLYHDDINGNVWFSRNGKNHNAKGQWEM